MARVLSDGHSSNEFRNEKRTHVQATGDTGTGKRLVSGILAADGHETRHLNLGELDLAAAEGSERLLHVCQRLRLAICHLPKRV